MHILRENIQDNRFLRLIEGALKAGYCEEWKYHPSLSGSPQGGIVSPRIGHAPIRRLLSRGKTSPYTTFDNFFPWHPAWHTSPTCGRRRLPVFLRVLSAVGAPPHPPIRIKAAGRLAGEPNVRPWPLSCPRKPSVPCHVQSSTAHTCSGSLTGPVSLGLTAEASPDSTLRWQASCHGLRAGRSTRLVANHMSSPSLPPPQRLAPPQPQAFWTSTGTRSRRMSEHARASVWATACRALSRGLLACCRWSNRGPVGLPRMAHWAASP
jgi:hypothetical protein